MLEKTIVTIPLTSGINDKISKLVKSPNVLDTLQNVDLKKSGEITKKNGYTLQETTNSNIYKLTEFDGKLCILDDNGFNTKTDSSSVTNIGFVANNRFEKKITTFSSRGDPLWSSIARIGDKIFYAYIVDGGFSNRFIYYSIFDESTQLYIKKNEEYKPNGESRTLRLIEDGSNFYLVYVSTGNKLCAVKFDLSGNVLQEGNNLADAFSIEEGAIDICIFSGSLYVVHAQTVSGTDTKVQRLSLSTLGILNTATLAYNIKKAAIIADDTHVYVVTSNNFPTVATWALEIDKYNTDLSTVVNTLLLNNGSHDLTRNNISLLWDSNRDRIYCYFDREEIDISATFYGLANVYYDIQADAAGGFNELIFVNSMILAGKVRYDSATDCHVLFVRTADDAKIETGLFLVEKDPDLTDFKIRGRYYYQEVGYNSSSDLNFLLHNDERGFQALVRDSVTTVTGGVASYHHHVDYVEYSTVQSTWTIFKNLLFITGSYLQMYDGQTFCEHNFLHSPYVIDNKKTNTGGNFSDGLVLFKMIYRWIDREGRVHNSAPSPTTIVTFSAGNSTQQVELIVSKYEVSRRPIGEIEIILYRTELDGSVFYRDSSLVNSTDFEENFIVTGANESDLISNEILYTESGQAANTGVSSCKFIDVFDDRLVLTGGAYKDEIFYSKESSFDFYLERAKVEIPQGLREISGFKPIDGKLVIFKEEKKFLLQGRGADVFGNGNYNPAVALPSEQGVKDENSIVLSSLGILFKSTEGIYLLDRGLNSQYIGSPVEDSNLLTVNDAISVEKNNEIRFVTDTEVMVYNYELNLWSRDSSVAGYKAITNYNREIYLTDGQNLYKENADVYTREGVSYSMNFKTSWIRLAHLSNFQRVWRVVLNGEFKGDHDVICKIYYDNDPTTVHETITKSITDGLYEYEILPARQRCSSIQLEFEFVGDNKNAVLNSIDFYVGIKNRKNRIANARRLT